VRYGDIVKVVPRFTRAVNIERDVALPSAITGYIITSTAHSVLARFARALAEPVGHRAWTITGSYGSGKSAFAVYLASLFGPRTAVGKLARNILSVHSRALFQELFDLRKSTAIRSNGFCPVVLAGSSEPLLPALIRAFARDVRSYCDRGRPPAALVQLEKLRGRIDKGGAVSANEFVNTVTALAEALQRSGRSQGVLVLIDELGKFLEFAARDTETDHIYLLQQLAEATGRFKRPGLLLITILHQSFETYVTGLRPAVRDEWAKVQGRFEDIAFQEPPEEFIALLSNAIQHKPHRLARILRAKAKAQAETAFSLALAPRGLNRAEFVQMMQCCAPLHPVTVLALARLCRKFGQNQRSLFSFLTSQELHGFSEFLKASVDEERMPFYRVDALYDYVLQSFGSGLTVGESSTRWAEVQSALDRCLASPEEERRVIKAVGVLSAIGAYGEVKPSPAVVAFALEEPGQKGRASVDRLIKKSVLLHRKHNNTYALWEGSDIDLDDRLRDAKTHIPRNASLARGLNSIWAPRPLVAKRHSAQTGTLRYFALQFVDVDEMAGAAHHGSDADGLLLYVLTNSAADAERAIQVAISSELRDRRNVLIAIPKDTEALAEAAHELELIRWVERNTPELQGDVVARRELRARGLVAEEHLAREIRYLFSPAEGTAQRTQWFRCGIPLHLASARSFSNVLSDICDSVYPHTPRLHNELINRRQLSSAAAAARRNLIEAMIARGSEERLGIQGTPPEMSMYVSVLQASGIHRRDEAGYGFGPPVSDPALLECWKAIEKFFAACELERRSVDQLFCVLQQPPYGLKMGLIPLLFCAAALAHDTEVAIYENGAFVPELTTEMFERLLRAPEKFELRRYRVAGIRREVFSQFASLLDTAPQDNAENLITVVRPLFRFFNRLPAYAKQTKTLSPLAQAVRDALFAAREPDTLLFTDLPKACGVSPFLPTDGTNSEIPGFFQNLRRAFSELQRAYDDLLSDIRQVLLRALQVTTSNAREILRFRARRVADHSLEPRLRAFIHHLIDDELEDVPWIEAIGSLLAGKPPRSWADGERAKYELNLSELARTFRHLEALAVEVDRGAAGTLGDVLRIGVTDRYSKDLESVVVVPPEQQAAVAEAVIRIEESLEACAAGQIPSLALAALATASRKLLSEMDNVVASRRTVEDGVRNE